MGLYEVPLSVSLLGFGIDPCMRCYVFVKRSFKQITHYSCPMI